MLSKFVSGSDRGSSGVCGCSNLSLRFGQRVRAEGGCFYEVIEVFTGTLPCNVRLNLSASFYVDNVKYGLSSGKCMKRNHR